MEIIKHNSGLNFKLLGYYFSVCKTKNCMFSRRNGYKGINLFGYNFYKLKIKQAKL